MSRVLVILFLSAWGAIAAIPADRLANWARENLGVVGGIPTNYTAWTNVTGIDATGASDVAPVLQSLIANCPSNGIIYLPAGTYRIDSPLDMGNQNSYRLPKIIRGAGTNTILKVNTWCAFRIGNPAYLPDYTFAIPQNTTNGQTAIPWAPFNGAAGEPGAPGLYLIDQENDDMVKNDATYNYYGGLCGWCSRSNGTRTVSQIVRVTGNTATHFTTELPVMWNLSTNKNPQAVGMWPTISRIGIENLKCEPYDRENVQTTIYVQIAGAIECWASGCEFDLTASDFITVNESYRCEIRRNYFHDQVSHQGGVDGLVMMGTATTACLVEDNIFQRCHAPMIMNWGATMNAYAYNFATNNLRYDGTTLTPDIGWHGAFPKYNLVEGNVVSQIWPDTGWGNSGYNTIYRNRVSGWTTRPSMGNPELYGAVSCIVIDGFSRNYSVVGNVLGSAPYATNGYWSRIIPEVYTWGERVMLRIGYRGSGDWGGAVPTDTNYVMSELVLSGNVNTLSNAVQWASEPETLQNSYIYTSKPSWWGTNAWPANGPDVSGWTKPIPAQVRFVSGDLTGTGTGGSEPPPAPGGPKTVLGLGIVRGKGVLR